MTSRQEIANREQGHDTDDDPLNIVVFGASGFIGSVVDRTLRDASLGEITGHSTSTCDLLSFDDATMALEGINNNTTVVMCAANGVRPGAHDNPETFSKNLVMVQNLLRALPSRGIRSLIYLSSVDVYGKQRFAEPISEDSPIVPESYYAHMKVVSEKLLFAASAQCGPTTVLRLPGIYGPSDRGQSVVGHFIRHALADEELLVHGDGSNTRDWISVSDVADMVVAIVKRPTHDPINLVKGKSHTILELISLIGNNVGGIPRTRHIPDTALRSKLEFDVSRLKKLYPEFSATSLENGIREYLAVVRS